MKTDCPSIETLNQFVNHDISNALSSELELHLNECGHCQKTLDQLFKVSRQSMMNLSLSEKSPVGPDHYLKPQIPGYEIRELAGAGGQGLIYKAWQEDSESWVAVKMLRHTSLDKQMMEDALRREARSVGQLNHPNIVRLHAIVDSDQGPAIILDWVEGGNLQDYLKLHKPTENEMVSLVMQLADALAHAHEAGILHRDIKPSNVLLQGGKITQPRLCDFGLAKTRQTDIDFSSTTVGIGTAGYMAPEMISRRFGRISSASDVYSLGALLYRMLTGVIPHESESPFETLERTCDRNVIAPSFFNRTLDWNLETICLKCLDRDADARYSNVKALKTDLQRYQNKERIIAGRVSWQRRLKTWSKEHPWIAILTILLCVLFTSSTLILTQLLRKSRISQKRAETELARSVETFRLSTPLIKRYIQLSAINEAETKRIVKIADLLRSMGEIEDDGNLRQRFDLIYSGLEIASELFQIKEQQPLAISMTRDARTSLGKLINDHGDELDRQGLLMIDGKIGISLLDQAMVRYGHACTQLFEMLNRFSGSENANKEYLIEAISTVEKVIAKNPEVDEAYSDLANYNLNLHRILILENKISEANAAIRKSFSIHDHMLKIYPNDSEKIHFWIIGLLCSLELEYQENGSSANFNRYIEMAKTKMNEIRNHNLTAWNETWPLFLECLVNEKWMLFDKTESSVKAADMDPLIEIWHEMFTRDGKGHKKDLDLLLLMQRDKLTLLQIHSGKSAMNDYYETALKFWNSNADNSNYRLMLAVLYLSKPGASSMEYEKALTILNGLPGDDLIVQLHKKIGLALRNGEPLEESPVLHESQFQVQMELHNKFIHSRRNPQNINKIELKNEIEQKYQKQLISITDRELLNISLQKMVAP